MFKIQTGQFGLESRDIDGPARFGIRRSDALAKSRAHVIAGACSR